MNSYEKSTNNTEHIINIFICGRVKAIMKRGYLISFSVLLIEFILVLNPIYFILVGEGIQK